MGKLRKAKKWKSDDSNSDIREQCRKELGNLPACPKHVSRIIMNAMDEKYGIKK